jgi:hypothetical protein
LTHRVTSKPVTLDYAGRVRRDPHAWPAPTSKLAVGALSGVVVSYPLGVFSHGGAMMLATMVSVAAIIHVYRSRGGLRGRGYAWAAIVLALLWWAAAGALFLGLSRFGPHPN